MQNAAAHPVPAHDSRIAEILALVRKAFVEKGFDGASMQDLARSVGMSVGNFYRYFPSKAAIVQSLAFVPRGKNCTDKMLGSDTPIKHAPIHTTN